MIVLYKGRRGSGKTLSMVKDGIKFNRSGYAIYRNFDLEFGKYISDDDILTLDKNSEIKNCVIMMDEVQMFFDSRRSMRKQSLNFSNFIQQIRKRNIILLCTTQYSNTIDLRLRQHIDVLATPKFIKELNVCEIIYFDLTSIEDNILGEHKQLNYVKMVYDALPIFKIYNTYQMINSTANDK